MKKIWLMFLLFPQFVFAQKGNTYCNPMNLGYAYESVRDDESHEAYRSG
jgi:hypothetical protein